VDALHLLDRTLAVAGKIMRASPVAPVMPRAECIINFAISVDRSSRGRVGARRASLPAAASLSRYASIAAGRTAARF
jgi:hypothetical protein